MKQTELGEKLARLRGFLREQGFDGVLLTRNENFCWLSCGHSAFVDKGTGNAAVKLLVTMQRRYVICSSSEMYRIPQEELKSLGFTVASYLWHESEAEVLSSLTNGMKLAADSMGYGAQERTQDITRLRYELTAEEQARYREIGLQAALVVEQCCRKIAQGQSEYEIAGKVTGRLMELGYQVPVCLIAADERLQGYRHPLPTGKRVERIAMIAVCAQKYGLTASLSRIVSLYALSTELERRHSAVCKADAAYILSTVEGARAGGVVSAGRAVYEDEGYAGDFHLHHQGGALGYLTRDYCANEQCGEIVCNKQAFSWNPTIAGTKSEDTFLVQGERQELLTHTGEWRYREISHAGKSILRPDILVLR